MGPDGRGRTRPHSRAHRPRGGLVRAIGQLAIHFPQRLHLEAWRVMTLELSKRELGVAANSGPG